MQTGGHRKQSARLLPDPFKERHVNAFKQPFKARACKTNYYADYPQKKPNKRTRVRTMTQRSLDRDGWIDRQILIRTCWLINCCWQQGEKNTPWLLVEMSVTAAISQPAFSDHMSRRGEREKGRKDNYMVIHLLGQRNWKGRELANTANREMYILTHTHSLSDDDLRHSARSNTLALPLYSKSAFQHWSHSAKACFFMIFPALIFRFPLAINSLVCSLVLKGLSVSSSRSEALWVPSVSDPDRAALIILWYQNFSYPQLQCHPRV